MNITLRYTENQKLTCKQHLHSGDDKEAVAIALCGVHKHSNDYWISIHKIHPIPYENCTIRNKTSVAWKTVGIENLLKVAMKKGLTILKIHSHPSGCKKFSSQDTQSDLDFFSSVHGWLENDVPCISAIMLPDGELVARAIDSNLEFHPVRRIACVGHDIQIADMSPQGIVPDYALRTAQTFGSKTTTKLKKLRVAVVGCSGTGGPVIEMLHRNNVGELILVDPKLVLKKNLNRIPNTRMKDAKNNVYKVHAIQQAIYDAGLETKVIALPNHVEDIEVINWLATCDVIFGCVDSALARDILNRITTLYCIPYIDIGVRLDADGKGGIDSIFSTAHYIQPGLSSLRTRGVYTADDVHAEYLKKFSPSAYKNELDAGYIKGVVEESPAVIHINTLAACFGVDQLLSRLHPYRDDPNSDFSAYRFSLTQGLVYQEPEGKIDKKLCPFVGRGGMLPILNMPMLTQLEANNAA